MIAMFKDKNGPIEAFDWGRFVINGKVHSEDGEGVGKDICIIEGEVAPWDERHGHRLNPDMVDCVFGKELRVLVIGNGVYGRIKVRNKTIKKLKAEGISEVIIEKTPQACKIFNQLYREGKRVGFLAHGTC